MRPARPLAGVLLLLAVATWAGTLRAEPLPPGAPPAESTPRPQPPPAGPAPEPALSTVLQDNGWVDRTHDYLSHRSLSTVQWFDDFFGDKTRENVAPDESTIRWRNNFRFGTDRTFLYRTDLRANVRLNRLSKRLRLVFSSEAFEDALGINRDATAIQGLTAPGTFHSSSTELRWEFPKSQRGQADVGAGALVKLPFVLYLRARYRFAQPLGDNTVLRLSPTAFWRTRDGLGQSMAIDLEHALDDRTFFRWGNTETTTQKSNGMEWNSEPAVLRALAKDKAATFAVGVSGQTRPVAVAGTWYVLARYRQSIVREWLFAEVEPIQSWVRGPTSGYHPVSAVTFRFEVFIQGEPPHPPETKAVPPQS